MGSPWWVKKAPAGVLAIDVTCSALFTVNRLCRKCSPTKTSPPPFHRHALHQAVSPFCLQNRRFSNSSTTLFARTFILLYSTHMYMNMYMFFRVRGGHRERGHTEGGAASGLRAGMGHMAWTLPKGASPPDSCVAPVATSGRLSHPIGVATIVQIL